jgi:hypothetical protein
VEGRIKNKFANNLNRMKDNRFIWISKNYLDNVKVLNDKQLRVSFELEEINKK